MSGSYTLLPFKKKNWEKKFMLGIFKSNKLQGLIYIHTHTCGILTIYYLNYLNCIIFSTTAAGKYFWSYYFVCIQ